MSVESDYRKLVNLAKRLLNDLPEDYEPERIERCISKYAMEAVTSFVDEPEYRILAKIILKEVSFKDAVSLTSKYIISLVGEDSDKSFVDGVAKLLTYLM